MNRLRFITYLAPALPEELFELVARLVGERLGVATSVVADLRTSGPEREGADPFTSGEADIGFLCAPPFLWLRDRRPPAVELVEAAWLFDDPRTNNTPVYFSDVIVSRESRAQTFADLRGGVWAYNDVCSLSGFHCLLRRIDAHFFREMRASGAHHTSIDWVSRGSVDAAAIDSNGLRLALLRDPTLADRVRVLESWGPHPIQPIVARASLPAEVRRAIADVLLDLHTDRAARASLAAFGVRKLVPVDESWYTAERAALDAASRMDALAF